MGNCKDCKWWQRKESFADYEIFRPEDPDTFEPMPITFETRYCTSPKLLFCERPLDASGATIVDGSGYRGALITGEDFGCTNFEAKDES